MNFEVITYLEFRAERFWFPTDEGKVRTPAQLSGPRAIDTHRVVEHLHVGSRNVLSTVFIEAFKQQGNRMPFVTPDLCVFISESIWEGMLDLIEAILWDNIPSA